MAAAKAAARKLTKAQREQRRRASTTHGAGSYLARTAEAPAAADQAAQITADMALVESRVLAEYADKGARGMVEQGALRFEVASALLWGHMQSSKEAYEGGLKTWGWLQGAAVRAWRDYQSLPGADQAITPAKVLESILRDNPR